MEVANCRIFINRGQDVRGSRVTPAEVIVLRAIHKHNVGSDPVKQLSVVGTIDRSDALEFRRLRDKYPAKDRKGDQIVKTLFPGDSPVLPKSFDGIWPDQSVDVPNPVNDAALRFDEPVKPLTEEETIRQLANA